MGSQKTKTKSQETATTTPNLNAAAPLVNNYYSGLGNMSGNDLKMPTNDLQTGLFDAGKAMLGQTGFDALSPAIGLLGSVQNAGVTQAQAPGGYTPYQATAATAQAPGAYTPAQAQMGQYGPLAMAQAPELSGPAQADVSTIAGGLSGAGVTGGKAIDFYQPYENKFTNDVVNSTLADLAVTQGEDRAAYARKGALNGGFGGSRFGVGETNLIDAQNRTKNTLAAQLRSQALDKAFGYGAGDADRSTQAGVASANNATQAAIAKANMLADAEMANTSAKNDFAKTGFQGLLDLSKTNTGYLNNAASDIFGAYNDMGKFNATQANNALNTQFTTNADIAQSNASNQNQVGITNANNANDLLGTQFTTISDMNKFNANAANEASRFNADLGIDRANALGNILNSAGQLDVSKMGLLSGIAGDQQAIDYYNSPAGQQELWAKLINGGGLLGAQTGQTINTSGTSTSKQSGGLLEKLLAASAQAASAAAAASERRVKRDIVKLGEEPDGLGVYQFRYVWDGDGQPLRFGTMVDEVERLRPWALGPVVDGVQTVDYARL